MIDRMTTYTRTSKTVCVTELSKSLIRNLIRLTTFIEDYPMLHLKKRPLISTGSKTEGQIDFRNKKEELAITHSECVFFKNNSLSCDFDRVLAVIHSTL